MRPLTDEDKQLVERIRRIALTLYEGKRVPHRSCGIAIAETLGRPTAPFQSLRKGGITGEGECGSIKAGELILGELLGDPDPAGPITSRLREAAFLYRRLWREHLDLGAGAANDGRGLTIICNHLVEPLGDFHGPDRQVFCARLASGIAALTCEVLLRSGIAVKIPPHLESLA